MRDTLRITIPAGEAPRHPFGDLNRGKKKQSKPVLSATKEKQASAKGKKEHREEGFNANNQIRWSCFECLL